MRRAVLLIPLAALALAGCGSGGRPIASTQAPTTAAPVTSEQVTSEPAATSSYAPPSFLPVTSSADTSVASQSPVFDAANADRAMCQITSDGGTFWLHLASADEHDYSACGGAALQADDLDAIFASGPGVDRRCVSNADQTDEYGALIGVYSSSRSADRAAAQLWCDEHAMTND